jgi:hypothetical protein
MIDESSRKIDHLYGIALLGLDRDGLDLGMEEMMFLTEKQEMFADHSDPEVVLPDDGTDSIFYGIDVAARLDAFVVIDEFAVVNELHASLFGDFLQLLIDGGIRIVEAYRFLQHAIIL